MELPYTIEVKPIPEYEGGGFIASLPEIGKYTITGYGDTVDEAINCLNEIKFEKFSEYLQKGIQIPEPKTEKEEYSGRFVLRMPKELHCKLSESAKNEGISLNQYTVYLLTERYVLDSQRKQFKTIINKVNDLQSRWEAHFSFSIERRSVVTKDDEYLSNDYEKAA